jgi:hypothetical protein
MAETVQWKCVAADRVSTADEPVMIASQAGDTMSSATASSLARLVDMDGHPVGRLIEAHRAITCQLQASQQGGGHRRALQMPSVRNACQRNWLLVRMPVVAEDC